MYRIGIRFFVLNPTDGRQYSHLPKASSLQPAIWLGSMDAFLGCNSSLDVNSALIFIAFDLLSTLPSISDQLNVTSSSDCLLLICISFLPSLGFHHLLFVILLVPDILGLGASTTSKSWPFFFRRVQVSVCCNIPHRGFDKILYCKWYGLRLSRLHLCSISY